MRGRERERRQKGCKIERGQAREIEEDSWWIGRERERERESEREGDRENRG